MEDKWWFNCGVGGGGINGMDCIDCTDEWCVACKWSCLSALLLLFVVIVVVDVDDELVLMDDIGVDVVCVVFIEIGWNVGFGVILRWGGKLLNESDIIFFNNYNFVIIFNSQSIKLLINESKLYGKTGQCLNA